MNRYVILTRTTLALVLASGTLSAQPPADSGRAALFSRRDAAFIALFSAASVVTTRFDTRIARRVAEPDLAGRSGLQDAAKTFGYVNEKSLFLAGVLGYGIGRLAGGVDAPATDVSLHVAEAVLISTVFNTAIRGTLGRSRPFITNGDDPYDFNFGKGFSDFDYRAFPSVHASSSFAAAAVLTAETRRRRPGAAPLVGLITYGLATMPGLARVYIGKHWASDILMGAFVGTLSGLKVVRYEHGRPDSWVARHLLR